jgi:hypothetical protein
VSDVSGGVSDVFFHNLMNINFTQVEVFEDVQRWSNIPKNTSLLEYYEYLLHIPLFNQLMKLNIVMMHL